MSEAGQTTSVRYRYPLHAMLLVAFAWVFFLALAAAYATVAIALFPLAPFIAIGLACMISMAHNYAISVRQPVRD